MIGAVVVLAMFAPAPICRVALPSAPAWLILRVPRLVISPVMALLPERITVVLGLTVMPPVMLLLPVSNSALAVAPAGAATTVTGPMLLLPVRVSVLPPSLTKPRVVAGTSVARQSCRNTRMTASTRMPASISVR